MVYLEYDIDGQPVSDFELENFVRSISEHIAMVRYAESHPADEVFDDVMREDRVFRVSTENVIFAVRRAIVRDEIDPADIKFRFEGKDFVANTFGVIKGCDELCGRAVKICEDILIGATRKKRRVADVEVLDGN